MEALQCVPNADLHGYEDEDEEEEVDEEEAVDEEEGVDHQPLAAPSYVPTHDLDSLQEGRPLAARSCPP